MKKNLLVITAVLMFALVLASCGKGAADVNIQDIYQKITESTAMPAEIVELTADDLIDYYGIDADKVAECVAVQDACGYKDEIVMIKAVDDASAKEIEVLLHEHIAYQKDSMKDYDPEQYQILGSSEVVTNGVYSAMFISAEQSTMAEIFNGAFK